MQRLTNTVRDYAWGAVSGIPELLGHEPDGTPQAELWIGAHPGAPSRLTGLDPALSLEEYIAADPERTLGAPAREHFGDHLPFLMKVLSAGSALSLQAHPNAEQAAERFAAEEASGLPRDAATRNYKDPFHKPEMVYALTTFEALCGFRDPAEILADLARLAGVGSSDAGDGGRGDAESADELLAILTAELGSGDVEAGLRACTDALLSGEVGAAVAELSGRASRLDGVGFATVAELARQYPGDPGVLISLFLNRVTLQPGEALMLPAGNMHAYLSGLGVEVMASSDNVMRGGLTPKHIDVPELLSILDFRPFAVERVPQRADGHGVVVAPDVEEFQLQRLDLPGEGGGDDDGSEVLHSGPAVVLCTRGEVTLTTGEQTLRLTQGDSAFISADEGRVAASGGGTLFATTVNDRVAASRDSAVPELA